MRTSYDFSPLFRSTVGFDRMFNLLESASRAPQGDGWPPYDIARTGDDAYRVTLAVAGFGEDQLTITQEPNLLIVAGNRTSDERAEYLHRSIPGQSFERRFELADHVKVTGARLENGLLTIELTREVPEAMKPRRIEIKGGGARPKQIEGTSKAA
jgi:molecular chaperone IbpA